MKELVGYPAKVDPRGNPVFIENIYKTMEREFQTKQRFGDRDWMAKNQQEKP